MKRLIFALLSLLGFGAVGCELSGGGNLNAYGTPYANFRLSLRVVDEAGEPIKGISVSTTPSNHIGALATTDQEGRVEAQFRGYRLSVVSFEDIDGEANGGEFETLSVDVTNRLVEVDDGGGKGWYRGEFEVDLGDVELKRK